MNEARRPLTVAHITGESGFSGGEVQVFLLMEGLRKRGHRNMLLCPPDSASEFEAFKRGIELRTAHTRSEWSPLGVARIRRQLSRFEPDLVHLHTGRANWLGGLAAWRLAIPAITTRRMDRPVKRNLRTRFVYESVVRRAVAISESVRTRLIDGGVPPGMTRVIRSAIDPEQLYPQVGRQTVRAEAGLDADTPCLLAVASLVHRKGIDVLLEAFARLDNSTAVLWIAGDGPHRLTLERTVRYRGLSNRVRFLGLRDDVPDLLAACDIFVLPSRHEGLGVAALEAMAVGRPVVASQVGGLAEAVVHDGTGLLVPPGDPTALADALARLLADPDLRARLAAAGPSRVQEGYLAEQMIDGYERLYFEVLEEAQRS